MTQREVKIVFNHTATKLYITLFFFFLNFLIFISLGICDLGTHPGIIQKFSIILLSALC